MHKSASDSFCIRFLEEIDINQRLDARSFCLDTIKETYGFDYRADWHFDLDSLAANNSNLPYLKINDGCFLTCVTSRNTIVATGGFYRMTDILKSRFSLNNRYNKQHQVAIVSRVYVRSENRRTGIGKMIMSILETSAANAGYEILYLHASSKNIGTIAFWSCLGFKEFGTFEFSTHFDKNLKLIF